MERLADQDRRREEASKLRDDEIAFEKKKAREEMKIKFLKRLGDMIYGPKIAAFKHVVRCFGVNYDRDKEAGALKAEADRQLRENQKEKLLSNKTLEETARKKRQQHALKVFQRFFQKMFQGTVKLYCFNWRIVPLILT